MATMAATVAALDPVGNLVVLRPGDETPEWFEPGNPEVLEQKPARGRTKKSED